MKNEKVAIMEKTEFNLIRLKSRNGVSLLAKTRKDNTLVEYLVEENSNNGKLVYGVGDDLHVAFMIFLRFIETAKKREVKMLIQEALKKKSVPCENPTRMIVLDLETTGLSNYRDDVLQVSVIDGDGNVLINSYVKPYYNTLWEQAQRINNISPDMVTDAPELHELVPKLKGIFESCDTIVGYNTYFDLTFLKFLDFSNKTIIDVMDDFAPVYGEWSNYHGDYKWQKLVTCAQYYGFDWNSIQENAHDSLGDCYATLYCYNKMKEGCLK